MDDAGGIGRMLIVLGAVLLVVGILLAAGSPLGRLPGDIAIRGDRWSFYFPFGTSIVISLALTVVFWFAGALAQR